jgi:uncharacterized membrane protein
MLTLLSMSVLTVVMLVTIVTAVADMDLRLPDGYVNVDPWSGVSLGAAGGSYQGDVYADLGMSTDLMEDGDSWASSQVSDPFQGPPTR